jgi:uncharacterized repeat protein (TIGR03803 family)
MKAYEARNLSTGNGTSFSITISPVVTPATLTDWTVNQAGYAQTISGSGGTAPYTFSAKGSLPPGLTLSGSGILAGTPTAPGAFTFGVVVTDGTGAAGTQFYTMTINSPVSLITNSAPTWTVDLPGFNQTILASGGTGALTFSSAGTLPAGLTLNSTTGVLSGTPTVGGSFLFTLIATDTVGASTSQNVSLTISLAVLPSVLPAWTINQPGFSITLTAAGATAPVSFALTGTLPPGLTLNSSGLLSGTPTTLGTFHFNVTATDSNATMGFQAYAITINPAVAITTTTLPGYLVDESGYSQTISASGGTSPLAFSTSGTLPPGLTLNSTTGVLTGTPTQGGSFSFTVLATDAAGASASAHYTVIISLILMPGSLPPWTANQPGYVQTITTTGGTAPYSYAATGTPPAGLTLSGNGVLTGTPTVAGSYLFTVTATDSAGAAGAVTYTLVINPPPVVTYVAISSLASFGGANGVDPNGGLVMDRAGDFLGTTQQGGTANLGTIFELQHGTNALTALASFNGTNGSNPMGSPLMDSNGNLFGTTSRGGASDDGTVFELSQGSSTITTLASFNGANGAYPAAGVVEDGSGNLFGTTNNGGSANDGTVFELPQGSSTITALASFNGANGVHPLGGLALDKSGNLFGTTNGDGYHNGTFFELMANSTTINTLVQFTGENGLNPQGDLLEDSSGNIFGTTYEGGSDLFVGYGTVFEVQAGSSTVTTLGTFNIANGLYPLGGLVEDGIGDLFGANTTTSSFFGRPTVYGSVYEVQKGSGTISTLVTFNKTNGQGPVGPMLLDANGNLYGATQAGGKFDDGTLFEVGNTLPAWTANQPGFEQTFLATGGTGTLSFSDAPPPGLSLSSSGVLSGTPTANGSFAFTVTASDSTGASGSKTFALTINHAVTITTTTLASGSAGAAYNQTIVGTGGTGSLTFSTTSSLPAGLTLSSSGLLSGTPTIVGNFAFTITATDAVGATASQTYTIHIHPTMVYVDPSFTGAAGSDPATDPGLGLVMGTTAFSTITSALANLAPGGTLVIFGGNYTEATVNFNTVHGAIDIATNPSDSPVIATVSIINAVTLTNSASVNLQGLAGIGSSSAANLTFGSTVDGPGGLTVSGNAGLTFGGPVSAAVLLLGGQLNPAATLTLAGSGSLTLAAGLSETIGALASSSASTSVQLGSGSSLSTAGAGSSSFAGSIGGSGSLNKLGTATTFTLSGSSSYTGPTGVIGTLTVNGALAAATSAVMLTDSSSVLSGSGSVLRPVLVSASGVSISGVSITSAGGIGVDIQPGAANVTVNAATVTGSSTGILVEPGNGNLTSLTSDTIVGNGQGLELLNGCVTATGNVLTGNNVGVYLPAVNPNNGSLPVDPLLTLEGNNLSGNTTGMQNSTALGTTAILNWWGNVGGPGAVDGLWRNPVVGVNVNDYTPYALDATSVGQHPTAFNFFNGAGSDGNVYVTGTLGQDTITASVDAVNANLVHVTGPNPGNYTRGGTGNRLIIYGFGDNLIGTRDTIMVSGSWNAEIHSAALTYREPLTFGGLSSSAVTTTGSGSDVLFGGGNDLLSANTSGNNVLVAGLSTGKTGAATAPRLSSSGGGANVFLAGYVDCTLSPLAPSGRLDYASLRAMDDLWAAGAGGMTDAMNAAALFSVANTPGAISTGTARAVIIPGSGKNWFLVKGAGNPSNTPTGSDQDYVIGSTANPSYRQAIQ